MTPPSQAKRKPASQGVLSLPTSLKKGQDDNDHTPSGLLNGKQHQQQLNRFLSKTFHMVNDNIDAGVVSWNATGDSFVIKDIDEFSKTTLPLYFNHSKYSSFVRQLNFYGFSKVRVESPLKTEEDEKRQTVCFYHEYFRKDRPDLLHKIYRVTRKSRGDDPISDGHRVQQLQREVAALHDEIDVVQRQMESKLVEVKESMQQEYEKRISNLEQTCMRWIVLLQSTSNASTSLCHQQGVPSSSPAYLHHHPFLGGLPSSCLSSSSLSASNEVSPPMVGVPRSFWPAELSSAATRRGSWCTAANGSTTATTMGPPASPLDHDNVPRRPTSSLSTTTALLLSAKEIINSSDTFMMPSSGFIR